MEFQDTIIKTDARKFIPFTENNVILSLETSFHLQDKELSMRAASGFYPMIATVVQAIYEEECYTNGKTLYRVATFDGFKELMSDEIDIFFCTSPNEIQQQALVDSNEEYVFTPICTEPIAILVNRKNPATNITVDELKGFYFDQITEWKELHQRIHTYQLVRGNGSQTCFENVVKNNPLSECHKEIVTMPDIIDCVAKDEAGITYAFWSYYAKMYANKNTKLLKINGYKTTDESYPLRYPLYMIYKKNNPNKNIRKLENFLLSEEGKNLIQQANRCLRDYGED